MMIWEGRISLFFLSIVFHIFTCTICFTVRRLGMSYTISYQSFSCSKDSLERWIGRAFSFCVRSLDSIILNCLYPSLSCLLLALNKQQSLNPLTVCYEYHFFRSSSTFHSPHSRHHTHSASPPPQYLPLHDRCKSSRPTSLSS